MSTRCPVHSARPPERLYTPPRPASAPVVEYAMVTALAAVAAAFLYARFGALLAGLFSTIPTLR